MKSNVDKCKIIHFRDKANAPAYKMLCNLLSKENEGKDLGVHISNNLKCTGQCLAATKKVHRMQGFTAMNFDHKTLETILTCYNAILRPHLE